MKTITNIVKAFDLTAKHLDWEFAYDEDADILYWTSIPVPRNDELVAASQEISFYLDRNANITGLMIEFFTDDFLIRNKSIVPIMKYLIDGDGVFLTIPEDKKKKANDLLVSFIEGIKRDIYQDDIGASVSNVDLEQMLSVSHIRT